MDVYLEEKHFLLNVFISNKTKSSYCTKNPCHEETNFQPKPIFGGIQPGPTQSHRRSLEAEISAYTSYSRSRNSRFGMPYPLLAYIAYPTTHFTQAYDTSMISAEMAVNGSLYSR